MKTGKVHGVIAAVAAAVSALSLGALSLAQSSAAELPAGIAPPHVLQTRPQPTLHDIVYAQLDASTGKGHLLDLYLVPNRGKPAPLVIFTHGSAWMRDNGRDDAQVLAAQLNKAGYAVAGVSIRSSTQAVFPAQLHDIKAAIRWLRANAKKYGIDPDRIGIVGESSGGWTAAMAATTGDVPELEGNEGVTSVSSAVQAAIAFYPPTDFLQMDRWALAPCNSEVPGAAPGMCHDAATSPESRLVGCAIQSCPEKTEAANPIHYISKADPPIMILHGESDALVPHEQGEALYQALNKACHDAVFISFPVAGHATWVGMMSDPALATAATVRSTSSQGCKVLAPQPIEPSWQTAIAFLDQYLK